MKVPGMESRVAPRPPRAAEVSSGMARTIRSTIYTIFLLSLSISAMSCDGGPGALPPPPDGTDRAAGEVRTAIESQIGLIAAQPADLAHRAELARIYQANNLLDFAVTTWNQVLEADDDNAEHWYCLSLALQKDGRYEEAIKAAAAARALAPNRSQVWWRPAMWEMDMGRPELAEPLAREAIRVDANNAGGTTALALSLTQTGKLNEAITVLKDLEKKTSHPYIKYLLGQAYQRAGNTELSQGYLQVGKAEKPKFPDPWESRILDADRGADATLARIDRLFDEGKRDEAARVIHEASESMPDNVNLMHRRADLYRTRGDFKRWTMELKRALKIEPENAVTHLNLSIAYRNQENYAQSMSHVVSAIKHNPLMADSHLQLARLHLLNQNVSEAVAALDEAFRLGVDDPREQLQYAHVLLRAGRFDEAERQARLVTFSDSQNPLSWAVLAETLDAQGKRQEAMAALDKGLLLDPNNQALRAIRIRFQRNPIPTG